MAESPFSDLSVTDFVSPDEKERVEFTMVSASGPKRNELPGDVRCWKNRKRQRIILEFLTVSAVLTISLWELTKGGTCESTAPWFSIIGAILGRYSKLN